MIPSLTVSSVDHKVRDHISVLVGNYEYYYACALLESRLSLGLPEDIAPAQLFSRMQELLADVPLEVREDATDEDYLKYLIKRYEPCDRYDEQMRELFLWPDRKQDLT